MRDATYSYFNVMLFSLCMGAAGFTLIAFKNHAIEVQALQTESTLAPLTLDYHILVADMAWQRGLWLDAGDHYLMLAQATQRADFALLATSAALEAEAFTLAHTAASLWAELDPEALQAQALSAMLAIMANDEELARERLSTLIEQAPKEALSHLMVITTSLEHLAEQNLFLALLQEFSLLYEHEAPIWFALARQAQSMKLYPFALEATDHSLALHPEWISAIALKVQILYQMKDKLAAKNYLEGVLAKQPHEDLQFIYTQIANELQ